MHCKSMIYGVIVTYRPDEAVLARVTEHRTQLDGLIIVENAAAGGMSPILADLAVDEHRLHLASLADNNLGKAQNHGIALARDLGATHVLLLDDDSEMASGMVAQLKAAYDTYSQNRLIGMVVPAMFDRGTGQLTRYASPRFAVGFTTQRPEPRMIVRHIFNPIASGSLIPLAVLDAVGLMDERFGIDYIDRDFSLRLLSRGYEIIATGDALLYHRIGRSCEHTLLGIPIRANHHDASRRFTIFRNRLICWRRHGLAVPAFLIYDMLAFGYDLFRIIFLEDQKKQKLLACLKGTIAGCGSVERINGIGDTAKK